MGERKKPENALGQNLRRIRKARRLSLREVSDRTDGAISNAYLCQLEKGDIKSPGLPVCIVLAAIYELTLDQMAAWINSPHENRPVCPACGQELEDHD